VFYYSKLYVGFGNVFLLSLSASEPMPFSIFKRADPCLAPEVAGNMGGIGKAGG